MRRSRLLEIPERLCQGEAGHSLIETALSLSILLTFTISVIAFSEAMYAQHYVAIAAVGASRYAMVRGSTFAGTSCSGDSYNCQATATDIQNYVLAHASAGISTSAITVATAWSGKSGAGTNCISANGVNSPGCDVQVTVSYAFRFFIPFLPKRKVTMQSVATLMIAE